MKKISLLMVVVCIFMLATGGPKRPKQVQGIPYQATLPAGMQTASGDYPEDPGDLVTPEGDFTFDMIQSWAGEGENRAALVIQWNDSKETSALVFGYRWDGTATGSDMIRAVVAANPQLYGLIQYTNVSSPTDPNGGYTINGFGWDRDSDGDIALIDTGNGNQVYESENGLFIHPRGYVPGQGGSSDYDYDNWKARDTDDFWGAGWYISYWSYWVKDSQAANFSYSSWGASGRVLKDGSWDGWNFSLNMIPSDWKAFKAAPAPIPEGAKTEFNINGLSFTLLDYNARKVAVAAPRGETAPYTGEIAVPAGITDEGIEYSVTAVADSAFYGSTVTTVTLPESVVKIGKRAFASSTLSAISVNGSETYDNITSIGEGAFAGCRNFSEAFYPAAVKNIPASLYEGTAVTSAAIPVWVEDVGDRAFADCRAMTEVVIPSTIKSIGTECFAGSDAITRVKAESTYPLPITDSTFSATAFANATLEVPAGYEATYSATPGWKNFGKTSTFILSVKTGDSFLFNKMTYVVTGMSEAGNTVKATYCKVDGTPTRQAIQAANKAYEGEITIPEEVTYQEQKFKVTALNDSAFYYASNVTKVTLPEGISKIGANTFDSCSALTEVGIPSSVKEIGKSAFAYCNKLTSVKLPAGLESLGERAFQSCSAVKELALPETLTTIPQYAFYAMGLESMTIGPNVKSIGNNLFQSCKQLKKVEISGELTELPSYLFSSCTSLVEVKLPSTIVKLGNSCFERCSSLQFEMPANVTTVGSSVFSGCTSIKEMTLPPTMTSIPSNLFYNCSALETVNIPEGVKSIGNSAFRNCTSFSRFNIVSKTREDAAPVEKGVLVLPSTVTSIENYGFAGCSSVKEVRLNDGLVKIGQYAFLDMNRLTDIDIPASVTSIGGWAFQNTSISKLVLPATTALTGGYVCKGCPDVVFYSCGVTPPSISTYSLATKNSSTFAPAVVPTGCESAYTSHTYWKKSAISAPVVKQVAVSDPHQEDNDLAMTLTFSYDMENLPERFSAANAGHIAATSKITVEYTPAGSTESTVAESVYENGTLKVSGVSLTSGQEYTLKCVVTLSDGTVVESAPISFTAASVSPVSPDEVKTWVGEGNARTIVRMRFNDGKGVENITVGVRFNAPASLESVMETLISADRRFYGVKVNGTFAGYGFDLNGDNVVGLKANGTALSGNAGLFSADSAQGITPEQNYDHWAVNNGENVWKAFRATAFNTPSLLLEGDVNDADMILLEYTAASTPSEAEYAIFPEPENIVGAWIPEGMSIPLSNEAYLPVLINVGAGNSLRSASWRYTDADGKTYNGVMTLSLPYASSGNTLAKITFKNITGVEYISMKPSISNVTTDYSAAVPVSVVEPVCPVESMRFAEEVIEASFDASFTPELIYTPGNPTFTPMEYTSSNTAVATVNKTTGLVSVKRTEGSTVITAKNLYDDKIVASVTVNAALRKPVTGFILGDGSENIELSYMDILALLPKTEPADADIQTFDIKISDTDIATTYSVRAFNPSRSFFELVTHKVGEFDLTLSAQDGKGASSTYHVKVTEPDRKSQSDSYQDGTFWLNEDWFGHTNGSINYITKDGGINYRVYESQNPYQSFGCTSQYATIANGKLVVMSKQADDGGDPRRGGGRVVVADANTLKKLASFDNIDGEKSDGRACVWAGHDKFYLGCTSGIRALDASTLKLGAMVEGVQGGSSYTGQIGDMVAAGDYVFAIQQSKGVYVIDPLTDKVVATFGMNPDTSSDDPLVASSWSPQGIAVTTDGKVWVATALGNKSSSSHFVAIDPATLEISDVVELPSHLAVSCGWGAWRSTNFFGAVNENALWFGAGVEASIVSGNTAYYKWIPGEDIKTLKPVFVFPKNLPGIDEKTMQAPYASVRLDERSGQLLIAATHGASSNYRYTWLHFVDVKTGEISRTIRMKDYYWFPALPVFPDKYAPEFGDIKAVSLTTKDQPLTIDFTELVSDRDGLDCNIRLSIDKQLETRASDDVADAEFNGKKLVITPKTQGSTYVGIIAESNGKTTSLSLPVSVSIPTGVSGVGEDVASISVEESTIIVKGMDGRIVTVYDLSGNAVYAFRAEGDCCRVVTTLSNGVYVIRSNDGRCSLKALLGR